MIKLFKEGIFVGVGVGTWKVVKEVESAEQTGDQKKKGAGRERHDQPKRHKDGRGSIQRGRKKRSS